MSQVIIQLGRYGDILSLLPLVAHKARNGQRRRLMVSKDFESILDGVSYVDRIVFDGRYNELDTAEQMARRVDRNFRTAQIYGRGYQHHDFSDNFQRAAWGRLGEGNRWESYELIFDRRDAKRELELACRFDWSKPVILVNSAGVSAPFPQRDSLFSDMQSRLGDTFNVIDISTLRAHRLYDMLGLFDRAHCLVSVDTSSLHLATASSVLVCALVNNINWQAAARRANHIYHKKYRQYDPDELAATIKHSLQVRKGKLIHVYAEWDMSPEDRRRWELARRSWKIEYATDNWIERPVDYKHEEGVRNSKDLLGDPRGSAYVKDMIEVGMKMAADGDDIVVLTNSDITFTPGMTEKLRRLMGGKDAMFGYRWDFNGERPEAPDYHTTVSMQWCGGLDFFAFKKSFWDRFKDKFPDMVAGRTHWDLIYRDLVKYFGGGQGYGFISHQSHASFWQTDRNKMPGNAHNLKLAAETWKWLDTTRPFKSLT